MKRHFIAMPNMVKVTKYVNANETLIFQYLLATPLNIKHIFSFKALHSLPYEHMFCIIFAGVLFLNTGLPFS